MKKALLFLLLPVVWLYASADTATVKKNLPLSFFSGKVVEGGSTAKVTGIDVGGNISFKDPYTNSSVTYWGGTLKGTLDNVNAKFYCVDLHHTLAIYTSGQPHTYTDSSYTPAQITYILNNYYPYKAYPYTGSASTVQKEASSVQFALWYFSDGADPATITDGDIKARAQSIIAAANANAVSVMPITTLLFNPSVQSVTNGTTVSFTVSAYDTNGTPLSGRTITLSTTSGTLSTTSVTTGATGSSPVVTLTQGSGSSAVITAAANVVIPQGTRYFHTVAPNDYQKLVLATPTSANRQVTSSISWYAPQTCDMNGYVTYTQGGWGSPDNSTPGTIRKNNFASVFPSGLTIGQGSNKATFTTAAAIRNYLPAGGTAGTISGTFTDPASLSAGVLGGQLVAMTLNVYFDSAGVIGPNPNKLGNLVFVSGTFAGKSIYQFLAIANAAVAGVSTGYSLSDINAAATMVNENFDNGTQNNGNFTCAPTVIPAKIGDKLWFDANENGIQDPSETGFSGATVKLYNCSDVLIATTTTNASGVYSFSNLAPGSYYVKFDLPTGYVFTSKDQGSDDTKDSDVDPATGKTTCTTLSSGEEDLTWDAGIKYAPATCATNWTGSLRPDSAICLVDPQWITITGSVALTPKPSNARLQTSWRIVYPTEFDTSNNYSTKNITNDTTFSITAWWPGIRSTDTQVSVHFGVNVLDCNGNTIHAGIGRTLYWNTSVCPAPAPNQSDIGLTKTANKDSVNNGENITFTVTARNFGPQNATNVRVQDKLPAGLQYVSHSASQGTYDTTTGIWTVGNMTNGGIATLTLTAKANVLATTSGSISLGPVGDFNLFVLRDLTQPSSDTEGKVAVGRSATLGGYSVGDKLPVYNFGEKDVLVVGQNLTFTSGAVYNGNVVYGNSSNLPIYPVSVEQGTVRKDSVIDFAAAEAYLNTLSAQLAGFTVNGTTTYQFGGVFCNGSHPTLNIFKVRGDSLSISNDLQINVPNGAVAVVNIYGDSVKWQYGIEVLGTAKNNVLFNFVNTKFLDLRYIDVTGSILAPKTDVRFVSGVMNGQMMCKSVSGQGQFNIAPFLGNIPVDSNMVNVATILGSSPTDPNSANNTASKSFKIKSLNNNNPVPGGSNWQLVTNFPKNEVVLGLKNDQNGNMLSCTMGGKIYRSNDGGRNFTRINEGMEVENVWSLGVNGATLFAATSKGLYRSTNNGSTWVLSDLRGKDVRAVLVTSSAVYAGTWGFGVFKSVDNGATWSVCNNGLTTSAVHALAKAPNGAILAGTFGGGMYRSNDGGNSWAKLSLGYDFVWSIGVTNSGSIIAGTYGNGIYRSTNNGDTWFRSNDGINSLYVYNVSCDVNDNLYVSTWASGVFGCSSGSNSWRPVGLAGSGANAVNINLATGQVFVGTGTGAIYVNDSPLGVKGSSEVPVEFALSQNYPNPFNPSTVIEFSVASKSSVSLEVYNILGQKVRTLISSEMNAGKYSVNFDARNLSSGVYFYTLKAGNYKVTRKMMLQK